MDVPIQLNCPWCGESCTSFYDLSSQDQSYVADCQVCCRPITIDFHLEEETGSVCLTEKRE
jgi:transcription elongation factor Elf1